jgi:tetratricopeptide (TPR) repeat protein
LASSLPLTACAAGSGGKPAAVAHGERTTPVSAVVGDDGFAAAVHDLLLSEPGSTERRVRLGAVEARQMARAAERFKGPGGLRGLAAVTGGLYLLHQGDATADLFGAHGAEALDAAARQLAAHGDEGRSRAVYDLLLGIAPEAARADVGAHLAAIDRWTRDALGDEAPIERLGSLERIAVRRRLFEPSAIALEDATRTTGEWIHGGLEVREMQLRRIRVPPLEEAEAAMRALAIGPAILAAIYLRDADAPAALAALGAAQVREILEQEHPHLAAALVAEAEVPDDEHCVNLLRQLRPLASREAGAEGDPELAEDHDVFGAAAFAVASLCYRLDPSVPEVALALGVALEELGMAEATPTVLVEAARAHPQPRFLGEALALSLDAMAIEEDSGDPESARRAYRAAQPLLAVASGAGFGGKVHPSAARVRAVMGEIELREGRIDEARALLKTSADEERSGAVLLPLARIEWRDGQTEAALGHLRDALASPDADEARDPALSGEIRLTLADVLYDAGRAEAARTALHDGLAGLMAVRVPADGRARVDRVLARLLDRFGAAERADRALERAFAAAPGDKRQATQTLELVVGRALVRGDLAAAREGLRRAVAVDLDDDDLVYLALWVRLLERLQHAGTDGAPDRVFAVSRDRPRWVATLARFGAGKVTGDELASLATTPIQKYEALFYDGLDHRAAGDTKGAGDLLHRVLEGTGLELSEVTLAREILDPSRAQMGGPLTLDVSIP